MSREIGVGDGRITNAVGRILNDDSKLLAKVVNRKGYQ